MTDHQAKWFCLTKVRENVRIRFTFEFLQEMGYMSLGEPPKVFYCTGIQFARMWCDYTRKMIGAVRVGGRPFTAEEVSRGSVDVYR